MTGPMSSAGLEAKQWCWACQVVIRLASKRTYSALGEVIITSVEAMRAILSWIKGVDYQGNRSAALVRHEHAKY
jgi:hypothetical protein